MRCGPGKKNSLNPGQVTGITGSLLVLSGVFLPIVRAPLAGRLSLFAASGACGAIMIAIALMAVIFVLRESFARLGATGFCAALVLAFVYFKARSGDLFPGSAKGAGFLEGVRRGLHAAAWKNIHYEWGLWVLLAGIALIIFAALIGKRGQP